MHRQTSQKNIDWAPSELQLHPMFPCFVFLWVLSALADPNFLSHPLQGKLRWFCLLWVLNTLAFSNDLLQCMQWNMMGSWRCIVFLCSFKRSSVTNVLSHWSHMLSLSALGMAPEISPPKLMFTLGWLLFLWSSSVFLMKKFLGHSSQEKLFGF